MKKSYNVDFDLNRFLIDINLKKQYLKNLKNKALVLSKLKEENHKLVSLVCPYKKKHLFTNDNLVTYIVDISFSRSNTFLHIMDFSGNLKFSYSSGSFNYSGKNKKARYNVFRDLYRVLISKLKFLDSKPIALHLKNVGYNKFWIVKKLKKKFFVKCVKSFNVYPHNGCRKRKMRRKKFKKRKRRDG